jgi:hypothetical protein
MLLIAFVVAWDMLAAITKNESLTGTFRCSIAQTHWRWPVLLIAALLLAHLFLPARLWRYDPLDRLYYRLNGTAPSSIPQNCVKER